MIMKNTLPDLYVPTLQSSFTTWSIIANITKMIIMEMFRWYIVDYKTNLAHVSPIHVVVETKTMSIIIEGEWRAAYLSIVSLSS